MTRKNLTQEKIKFLFDYRGGELIRKVITGRCVKVGDVAGGPDSLGYIRISVDDKRYLAHRLIWLWHYGYFPEYDIDHINRIKDDNRIENLREVGRACNLRNTGNRKNNASGVKGVCWHKESGKWQAKITVSWKMYDLGKYADFLEAVCHRLAAEQALDWSGCDDCSPAFKYIQKHICTDGDK